MSPAAASCAGLRRGGEVNLTAVAFSPDGKTLAAGTGSGSVQLWEVLTGAERRRFTGHHGWVGSVAFAPDGRVLASGGHDTTVLLWDVTGRRSAPVGPVHLRAEQLDILWTSLASEDGEKAYAAMWVLANAGEQAVTLLGERLLPVKSDSKRVARLIAELDDDDFATRERASAELAASGEAAAAALRAALEARPSAEAPAPGAVAARVEGGQPSGRRREGGPRRRGAGAARHTRGSPGT